MIRPGRLMPDVVVSTGTPHNAGHIGRVREDGGELRSDFTNERRGLCAGIDEDVVTSTRKLEVVHGSCTQRISQFHGETLTGLIPVVSQSWERNVTPLLRILTVSPLLI